MRTRPLGKTGLHVSELALGTWGLSGDACGPVDPADAERVLARALDIGVSLLDTADSYGGGAMEAMIGRVLVDHPHVVVVTKIGTDRSTDPAQKRFEAAYLRLAVQRSLKRLGKERLDVALLHNPGASTLHFGEATDTMAALKKEGLVAHWGLAAGDVDAARAGIERGAEVVELAYGLLCSTDLHHLAGDIMVDKVGVLARSVLGYGVLGGEWREGKAFEPGDHREHRWTTPELGRRIQQADALRHLVRGEVRSLRGAAVRYVLANHLVSSAVLGPRSVEQLEQLVRETGSGPRYLPDADLRDLPHILDGLGIPS